MTQIIAQIVGHTAKPAGTGIVHEFNLSDGKVLKTWKQDIADQAVPFVGGESVTIDMETVTQNKNGRVFTDNYINGVLGADLPQDPVVGQATPAAVAVDNSALIAALEANTEALQTLTDALLAQPEA